MNFKSKNDLLIFLNKKCQKIGWGSQGDAYYNYEDHCVYKIFYEFYDDEEVTEYEKDKILEFSSITNDTFIWANDIILVNDALYGYRAPYASGKSLYKIDPLRINLDSFNDKIKKAKNDLWLISEEGILTCDIMYNILYDKKISIIDNLDYSYSTLAPIELYKRNSSIFDYEIYYFLVDFYFDEFVNSHKELKELYEGKEEDVLVFLRLFRQYLSEALDENVTTLGCAKKYVNKNRHDIRYQREL